MKHRAEAAEAQLARVREALEEIKRFSGGTGLNRDFRRRVGAITEEALRSPAPADATPTPDLPSEAREDGVKEREAIAAWNEAEARRWNAELWDRRSWGGPTIGAEECILAEKIHKEAAARIRSALTVPPSTAQTGDA